MKRTTIFGIALIFILSSGGINAKISGVLNPKFNDYKLTNVIVFVENKQEIAGALQSEIVDELNKRGVQATGVTNPHLYSGSDMSFFMNTLRPHRDKDYLFVIYADAEPTATAFGYVRNYGTNFKVRAGNFSGEKIWEANSETPAQGSTFDSDNKTTHEVKSAIIRALQKDQLIH